MAAFSLMLLPRLESETAKPELFRPDMRKKVRVFGAFSVLTFAFLVFGLCCTVPGQLWCKSGGSLRFVRHINTDSSSLPAF